MEHTTRTRLEREGEHKTTTKSRNVFYILFVGAHRVVEINKPNENETEQKENKQSEEAAATTEEAKKKCCAHTNSHFYLLVIIHERFLFFSFIVKNIGRGELYRFQCSLVHSLEFGQCNAEKCINPIAIFLMLKICLLLFATHTHTHTIF